MSRLTRGDTTVAWLEGGLYVEHAGVGLVLDVPPLAALRLGEALGRVQAVSLSGGRLQSVGGLVALLCAIEPHRTAGAPLALRFPFGEERGAMLAEAWVRGWPDRYPLSLDAEMPGAAFEVGAIEVETVRLPRGEPRWSPSPVVESALGLGFRVRTPELLLAFAPGAAPSARVARLCEGVDLAVIEVGVLPWPRSEDRWRLSVADALAAAGPAEVWLVGDDGRLLGAEA